MSVFPIASAMDYLLHLFDGLHVQILLRVEFVFHLLDFLDLFSGLELYGLNFLFLMLSNFLTFLRDFFRFLIQIVQDGGLILRILF